MGEVGVVLGQLLISILLNTYVTGIAGFQYISYRAIEFDDSWIIKAMVMALCLIDVFQACAGIYITWVYCVTNYLNPSALSDGASWVLAIIPILNACSGIAAHIFLAHRIYKTTGRKVTSVVVVGLTLITFGLGIVCGASGIMQTVSLVDITKTSHAHRILETVWLTVQATTNLVASSSLAFIFSHSRPPFMDHLSSNWSRLCRAAIQSGSQSSLLSLVGLLAFVASPHNVLYMVFILPLGRSYSICIMDSLIARDKRIPLLLANLNDGAGGGQTPFLGSDGIGIWATGETDIQAPNFSLIQVKTEREIFQDKIPDSERNENANRDCDRQVITECERGEVS